MVNDQNLQSTFNAKDFLGSISILAFSSIIKFIVQIAIVVLFAKKLSLTDYGIYQFIWMYINFFSVIGLFGLSFLMLSTSLADIINWIKTNKHIIISTIILINSIAIAYLFFFNSYFTILEKLLVLSLLLLQNISLLLESLAIKAERIKFLFWVNLLYLLLYGIVHIYLIYANYSVVILLAGIVISIFIKCSLLLFITQKEKTTATTTNTINVGKEWFYLGINDSLGVLAKWVDKWIVLAILPVAQFAIYFNGTYEVPIFLLLLGAVGNISIVEISKHNIIDKIKIKAIFEQSATLLAIIILPSFWFLLFYCKDIFQILFEDKYLASVPIFKISLLIMPLRIIYPTAILQAFHKNNIVVKGAILDFVLVLFFMCILYPIFNMQGLAFAFVLSTLIQVGYYLWESAKAINEKISFLIPFKRLFSLLFISFFVMGSTYFLTISLHQITSTLLAFAVCCFLILFLLLFYHSKINIINKHTS